MASVEGLPAGASCFSVGSQSCVTDTSSTVYQPGHEVITPADSGVSESQPSLLGTCSVRRKTRATQVMASLGVTHSYSSHQAGGAQMRIGQAWAESESLCFPLLIKKLGNFDESLQR